MAEINDNQLQRIFDAYNPELTSTADFMQRLNRELNAVEIIKQRNDANLRATKISALIACVVGFIMGAILSLMQPVICNAFLNLQVFMSLQAASINIISWCAVGLATVVVSCAARELSIALMPSSADIKKEAA